MSKRIMLVGLAALCALALGALGASGASAAETTAYTCLPGTGGTEFGNAHCSEAGTGFHHVAIPAGEETQITLSAVGQQLLASHVFGAEVELSSNTLECVNCMAANSGSAGSMKVSGSGGNLKYSGVVVNGTLGTKCKVLSDPGEVEGVVNTEPLKFETIATNEALISPVNAENILAHFWIKHKPEKTCNIEGTYTVTGDANGITSGATLKVAVPIGSGTLKLNTEPAGLTGEATIQAGLTGGEHHPAALT